MSDLKGMVGSSEKRPELRLSGLYAPRLLMDRLIVSYDWMAKSIPGDAYRNGGLLGASAALSYVKDSKLPNHRVVQEFGLRGFESGSDLEGFISGRIEYIRTLEHLSKALPLNETVSSFSLNGESNLQGKYTKILLAEIVYKMLSIQPKYNARKIDLIASVRRRFPLVKPEDVNSAINSLETLHLIYGSGVERVQIHASKIKPQI